MIMKLNLVLISVLALAIINSWSVPQSSKVISNLLHSMSPQEARQIKEFSESGKVEALNQVYLLYMRSPDYISKHKEKKERLGALGRKVMFINLCHGQRDAEYDPYDAPVFASKMSMPSRMPLALVPDMGLEDKADEDGFVKREYIVEENERRKDKYCREMGLLRLVENSIADLKLYRDSLVEDSEERTAVLEAINAGITDSSIRQRLLEEPQQDENQRVLAIRWKYYRETSEPRQLHYAADLLGRELQDKANTGKTADKELIQLLEVVREGKRISSAFKAPENGFATPTEESSFKNRHRIAKMPMTSGIRYINEYLGILKEKNPAGYTAAVAAIAGQVADQDLRAILIKE
jgi:hypothetical protein